MWRRRLAGANGLASIVCRLGAGFVVVVLIGLLGAQPSLAGPLLEAPHGNLSRVPAVLPLPPLPRLSVRFSVGDVFHPEHRRIERFTVVLTWTLGRVPGPTTSLTPLVADGVQPGVWGPGTAQLQLETP